MKFCLYQVYPDKPYQKKFNLRSFKKLFDRKDAETNVIVADADVFDAHDNFPTKKRRNETTSTQLCYVTASGLRKKPPVDNF